MVEQKLTVVREGYERVLSDFLEDMREQRREKIAKTGVETFTEFEALMPELVKLILPDRKCRIVLECDPAAPRVVLRREITEGAQA